jgi:hypothetical protein
MELMAAWIDNGKTAMQPARELNELTKSTLTRVAEQQVATTKEYVEFGKHSIQTLGATRDPRALVKQQVALTKELSDKFLDTSQTFTKLATATQASFAEWVEKTAGTALAKAEAVVKKAA